MDRGLEGGNANPSHLSEWLWNLDEAAVMTENGHGSFINRWRR